MARVISRKLTVQTHLGIFQFFGTLPLSGEYPSFSEVSWPCLAYGFALTVFQMWFFIISPPHDYKYYGRITAHLFTAGGLIWIVIPVVSVLEILRHRSLYQKSVIKLIFIQLTLKISQYGMYLPIKAVALIMSSTVLCNFVIRSLNEWSKGEFVRSVWVDETFWNWYYVFVTSTCCQYTYLLCVVGACFNKIENSIRRHKSSQTVQDSESEMRIFVQMHHDVNALALDFHEVFQLSISLILLGLFVSSVLTVVVLAMNMLDPWETVQYGIWLFHHVFLVHHIMWSCESVIEKVCVLR